MADVTLAVPVIVRGRHHAAGETVKVDADQAKRFERKGWVAPAKKHTSTRAKGGPKPKATESTSAASASKPTEDAKSDESKSRETKADKA